MSNPALPHIIKGSLQQIGMVSTPQALACRGDNRRAIRVPSEGKLTRWIKSLVNEAISAHENAFNDQEKDQVLRAAQVELVMQAAREQPPFSLKNFSPGWTE